MIWREPKNHFDDGYFCAVKIVVINRNNRDMWFYSDLPSVKIPLPHSDLVPVPHFREMSELSEDESFVFDALQNVVETDTGFFDQNEFSDLIRNLNISKDASRLLASRLKGKSMLKPGTKVKFYRRRKMGLLQFFAKDIGIFCVLQ